MMMHVGLYTCVCAESVSWNRAKMAVAINTMDAIKKKMQAMKLEKENAFDKADQLEQKLNEQKLVFEKV